MSTRLQTKTMVKLREPAKKPGHRPGPKKAPLAQYVRAALGDAESPVLDTNDNTFAPELVQGKVCRILTYRGSFNPSHQGPKNILCHGFFRGGNDLNIVAAFLYFLDELDVS